MKIALIGQKGYNQETGGIERHVKEITKRLAQSEVEFLIYSRKNLTPPEFLPENLELKPLPSPDLKHLKMGIQLFLASIDVLFQDVDIIHYHGIGPAFFLFIPKILAPNKKIILTYHCKDYNHKKWGPFTRLFLKVGEYMGVKLADKVITVSPKLKKELKNRYNREAEYIPNGTFVPQKNNKNIIKKWNLSCNGYILTVNRLIAHKNIHLLIQAFQDLNPNKKLAIAGGATFTEQYEKRLKKLASDNPKIVFLGTQTGEALQTLYQNAKVFVQPSESEGLSTSILEAMAAQTPVLASNIQPNKFLITNEKFLFQVNDKENLKESLKESLKLPELELKEEAEKNRKKAKKEFNWDKIAKRTESVYNSLLPSKAQVKTKKA